MDKQWELDNIKQALEDGIISESEYKEFSKEILYGKKEASPPKEDYESTFAYSLLGFLMPGVGLLFFIMWRDGRPARAKASIKGVLAGGVTYFALIAIGCLVSAISLILD